MQRMNEKIYKRMEAEGNGSGEGRERRRDTGMEGERESCIINPFAS